MYLLLWDEPISGTQYETLEDDLAVVERIKDLKEIGKYSLYHNKVANIKIFHCMPVVIFNHLIEGE